MSNDDSASVRADRRIFLTGVAAAAAAAGAAFTPELARATVTERSTDVRDFGAVGDGQTDDAAAIQAAIDHAERERHPVLFSPGTYRVTRTIRVRSEVDLVGTDASYCVIQQDLRGTSAAHRRDNAACILVDNTSEQGAQPARYVSVRHLRLTTSEPRADIARDAEQTGLLVRNGFWNFRVEETVIQDFAVGISLRDCWTARVLHCSVERSNRHCLHWENATAGEITGNRLDCITSTTPTGVGGDCVYVTFTQHPPFHETLALSVANNSFQGSEAAGFHGVGLGNVTFVNNFFENNNRAGRSAALMLEESPERPPDPGDAAEFRRPALRMVNLTGGFITPGAHGHGPAVCIGNYQIINVMGLDMRGGALGRGLHLFGRDSRINIIGVNVPIASYVQSSEFHVTGSILPLLPRRPHGTTASQG